MPLTSSSVLVGFGNRADMNETLGHSCTAVTALPSHRVAPTGTENSAGRPNAVQPGWQTFVLLGEEC